MKSDSIDSFLKCEEKQKKSNTNNIQSKPLQNAELLAIKNILNQISNLTALNLKRPQK